MNDEAVSGGWDGTFEALQRFRCLTSQEEKLEALFLQGVSTNGHLRTLNGTTEKTAQALALHLQEHEAEEAGLLAMRTWGGRVVAGFGFLLILCTLLVALLTIYDYLAH